MKIDGFSDRELAEFLARQRLSYAIQASVIGELYDGITERAAARLLMKAYRAEGVQAWFHLPVVPFGDRTSPRHPGRCCPSGRPTARCNPATP